jgi:hypothetical protein
MGLHETFCALTVEASEANAKAKAAKISAMLPIASRVGIMSWCEDVGVKSW